MKKIIFLLLIILLYQNIYSQENKLQLQSLSVAIGNYQPNEGKDLYSTFYTDFSLITNYNKNLFLISVDGTFPWLFSFLDNDTERENIQISFYYGRNYKIYKRFSLESFVGIGYFKEKYSKRNYSFVTWNENFSFIKNKPNESIDELTLDGISFPVKLRLLFEYNKKNSIGLNYSHSFNSISNYGSIGLIFSHNF